MIIDPTPLYRSLRMVSAAHGERRDCSVIALSIALDVSYAQAQRALADAGRVPGRGATDAVWRSAVLRLGFCLERVTMTQIIRTYPKRGRKARCVTTKHPAMFPAAFADLGPLLFVTRDHMAALRDGVLHDWSSSRSLQCYAIFRPLKLMQPEPF